MSRTAVVATLMLAVATAHGQAGPPVCPSSQPKPNTVPGQNFHPVEVTRPSVAAARRTTEAVATDPSVLLAAEPMENFGVARYRVKDYADCVGDGGCYWSDVRAQADRAAKLLGTLDRQGKQALILDIDETVLSSYCEMQHEDFGYIPEMFNRWVITPEAAIPIPGMLALFQQARAAGIAVFFLTGRPEEQRAGTERNLHAAGYDGWAGVILRNADEKKLPTVAYKSAERAKLVAQGYRLVMSVGDQWSDLVGEPKAQISVKMPNPFYYLP